MAMASRVLVALLVALLAAIPAAQQASTLAAGHAPALKHAARTPPNAARLAVVERPHADHPAAMPFAGFAPAEPADLVVDAALDAPFVPPRI